MTNEITPDDKLEAASRKKFDQFAVADKQNVGKGVVYQGFLRKLGTEVGLMLKRDKNLPWSNNLGILVSSGLDIVNLSTLSGLGLYTDPRIIMAGEGIKMDDILRAHAEKFAGDPKLARIYAAHATGEAKRTANDHDKIRLDISEIAIR